MKRLALLLLLALVPAPSTALADGCPLPCSGQSSSPTGTKFLFVQPDGPRGKLVAWNTTTRQAVFSLPPGIASANGRTYYSASRNRVATYLKRFVVGTAFLEYEWSLHKRWFLQGVSPTGRWVALARREAGSTKILVFDGRRGRRAHVMRLRGNFEVETISRDGRRMFLIEHLAGRAYNVRQYDLSRGAWSPTRCARRA